MHKLYYSPSSCSLAPHVVLEEIGAPYETELVIATDSAMTGTPEWHAINPKGRVPVLTNVPGSIGGAPDVLTEVPAILTFLGRSDPAARLLPEDAAGQARAAEWMNWLSGSVHAMSFGQIWRPHRFIDDPELFPAVAARGRANLADQFAYIESLIGDGRDWALPSGYSVVDPYLLVFWRWGRSVGFDMSSYAAWSRWATRIYDRSAVLAITTRLGLN